MDWRDIRNGNVIPSNNYCDQPYIVITDDVLINKAEGNSQSRIQGYLDDGILVSAERGIGYQLVSTDGRRSEVLALRPREATSVPDWERLGLQSLGDEYE